MGSKYFEDVKKNFGFGCMRLPMNGEEVDYDIVNIGLHFFHKDVRPMQLPVKKYSTVVA